MTDAIHTMTEEHAKLVRDVARFDRRMETIKRKRAESEQKIAAIELVLGDVLGQEIPNKQAETGLSSTRRSTNDNSLAAAVRAAIQEARGRFNAEQIHGILTMTPGSKHVGVEVQPIRKVLARFARRKEIVVVEEGVGKRAAIYRRIGETNSQGQARREEQQGGQDENHNGGETPNTDTLNSGEITHQAISA